MYRHVYWPWLDKQRNNAGTVAAASSSTDPTNATRAKNSHQDGFVHSFFVCFVLIFKQTGSHVVNFVAGLISGVIGGGKEKNIYIYAY